MAYKYKIHILNRAILWRNDYKHICDDALTNKFTTEELNFNNTLYNFNFNYNDGLTANITIPLDETTNHDIFLKNYVSSMEAVNKNYCIVEETNEDTTEKTKYFYFINSAEISNLYVVKYYLELDVFTTYYNATIFNNGTIRRAHVNRFKRIGNNAFFDNSKQTFIYNMDDNITAPKHLTKQQKIKFMLHHWNESADDLDAWLNNNVIAWKYIFLETKAYKMRNGEASTQSIDTPREIIINNIKDAYSVLCLPIYKTTKRISIKVNDTYYNVNDVAIEDFLKVNNNYSYIYSVKISNTPPFYVNASSSDNDIIYNIDANGNLIINGTIPTGDNRAQIVLSNKNYAYITNITSTLETALFNVQEQSKNPLKSEKISLNYKSKFTIDEIKTDSENYKKEPSIYNNNRYDVKITYNGQTYTKNIMELESDTLKILYYEPLSVGITKINIKWDASTQSIYNDIFNVINNVILSGGLITDDTTLNVANDKLSEILANNKNYYLQQQLGLAQSTINGALQLGATGNYTGLLNTGFSALNTYMSNDALNDAPNKLTRASGSVIFNNLIHDLGVYLEVWETPQQTFIDAYNYYNKKGHFINETGNISNYANTRKYFNYIETEDITININVAEEIKNKIINAFNNGLTIWHNITYFMNYYVNNYENILN